MNKFSQMKNSVGKKVPPKGAAGVTKANNDVILKSTQNQDKEKSKILDDETEKQKTRIIRPTCQLSLSDHAIQEDITIVLTANDPKVSINTVKYNYKDKNFKKDPEGPMDHLAFHFQLNGSSLHASCEDAIQQKMYVDELKFKADKLKRELLTETQEFSGDGIDFSLLMPRKCQFTHTDRSIQTLNSSMVSRSVETKPPSVVRFVAAFSQCTIFDEYIASIEKGTDESKMQAEQSNNRNQVSNAVLDIHTERTALSLKVLERMVNQNAEDEIFQDFKYWEDVSDLFRAGFGSLLPLWKFSSDRCKRKHVTALKWNPAYPDLFAVAYGSFDFMHQATGALSFFSLKNTSYPEYHFATESGVMTLDFHPQRSSLVAVGCYDGNVLVFDVRVSAKKPIYCSSIKTGKHTDPVWQVQWQNEEPGKDLFFFSVSSDGQVLSWSLSKSELKMEPAMQLKLIKTAPSESDDISFSGLAGGCCFDFSKKDEANFLVGTEEGKIHSCSKAYTGHYLRTFIGHNMAVYTNKWNPFHPDIFISCSADWTVKLWDRNMTNPVFSFDLGDSVGDVSWAPYSSTTFAAVTSDGKIFVYDLSVNKLEPLCEQKVVKKAKLTRISFNETEPILIVGDDRGCVLSLKLSPNLLKSKHLDELSPSQSLLDIQVAALEDIIQTARS